MGLKEEDVNSARNFLRLHKAIERAFDHKRLYFEHVPSAGEGGLTLRVRVLDPDLLKEEIVASETTVRTFGDIDEVNCVWSFPGDKFPFRRLLSLHSLRAVEKARALGWIADDADAISRRTRNLELARYSLGENSIIMDAFFSSS